MANFCQEFLKRLGSLHTGFFVNRGVGGGGEPGPLEKSSRGRPSDYVYERPDTNGSIRRVMALPFLPLETIAATFDSLKPEAKTEPLQQFVSYIEENWIRSTLWLPETAKLTVAWRRLPLTSREVTGAAAQRMGQYKQATDALN